MVVFATSLRHTATVPVDNSCKIYVMIPNLRVLFADNHNVRKFLDNTRVGWRMMGIQGEKMILGRKLPSKWHGLRVPDWEERQDVSSRLKLFLATGEVTMITQWFSYRNIGTDLIRNFAINTNMLAARALKPFIWTPHEMLTTQWYNVRIVNRNSAPKRFPPPRQVLSPPFQNPTFHTFQSNAKFQSYVHQQVPIPALSPYALIPSLLRPVLKLLRTNRRRTPTNSNFPPPRIPL